MHSNCGVLFFQIIHVNLHYSEGMYLKFPVLTVCNILVLMFIKFLQSNISNIFD